jgi:hypothetical protein
MRAAVTSRRSLSAAPALQSCRGEGETWTETEYLEVVDGKLKRVVQVEGKRQTFTYSRCPARVEASLQLHVKNRLKSLRT